MTYKARLRKVGGSVMLAIPPALLEAVELAPDAAVGLTIKGGQIVVQREARPRYSLDDLLAQCNVKARRAAKDRAWVAGKSAGRELI